MVFDARGALAEAARRCEAAAFDAHYGISRHQLDAEFTDFEESSVFLAICDADDVAMATARLVTPGPAGPKFVADLRRGPWDLDGLAAARDAGLDLSTTWDIATVGSRPQAGRAVSLALYHGLHLAASVNDVTATVAVLNESVRRLLGMRGLFFDALPGARTMPFDGSPASTPVYARHAEQVATARRRNPEGYRLVIAGIGLDGISVPPRSAFELQRDAVRLLPRQDAERVVDLTTGAATVERVSA